MGQSEKHKDEEDARIKASGQVVPPSLYFTKQSAWGVPYVPPLLAACPDPFPCPMPCPGLPPCTPSRR